MDMVMWGMRPFPPLQENKRSCWSASLVPPHITRLPLPDLSLHCVNPVSLGHAINRFEWLILNVTMLANGFWKLRRKVLQDVYLINLKCAKFNAETNVLFESTVRYLTSFPGGSVHQQIDHTCLPWESLTCAKQLSAKREAQDKKTNAT